MNTWTDCSENFVNKWAASTRTDYLEHNGSSTSFTVKVEQINKRWDLANNWHVTLTSSTGVLMQDSFYLSIDNSSVENAQKRAMELVDEYLNPKPTFVPLRFVAGSQKAMLVVQDKSYGLTEKGIKPNCVPKIVGYAKCSFDESNV